MSGGSYDYVSYRVEEAADTLESWSRVRVTTIGSETFREEPDHVEDRKRMAEQLRKAAEAMYVLEWHDSGDAYTWEEVVEKFNGAFR